MTEFRGLDRHGLQSNLLSAMPGVSLIIFDRELRIMRLAGQVPTRYGVSVSQAKGSPVSEVLVPDHWQRCETLLCAALAGRPGRVEFAAGGGRWYRVDVEPWLDAGLDAGGVCLWRDITELKRLVDELEQRGRLMDMAHDAVIVRSPADNAVTYWNRQAEEMYGYSAEEARGRITHDLLATEFPETREAADAALLKLGRWEGELRHTRKDGRRILVSSRQALVHDEAGGPAAVIELNSDITERRHAEDQAHTAEQRFRGLIESAPDAMVIVNTDGLIVRVNDRAESMFGYSHAELVGQPVEMLLPETIRERHIEHRERFIAEPRARPMGAGMDLMARRKDGSEFAAEISLGPVQTDEGLLISAAVRDISEQLLRQLEHALIPRMKIGPRWELAWRYRPCVRSMLLGGDFIGVCERTDGTLALMIGDVAGHGAAAAGTGGMLRAAWLGAVQGDLAMEAIPRLLHRLVLSQADAGASTMATACLAEIDADARELRLIRAGHDSPLLITADTITAVESEHGPALGLGESGYWPVSQVPLPREAALMLFTDGLTERRATPGSPRRFDALGPRIDTQNLLTGPPGPAIDELLAHTFPDGTDRLDDDVAVILLNLRRMAAVDVPSDRVA